MTHAEVLFLTAIARRWLSSGTFTMVRVFPMKLEGEDHLTSVIVAFSPKPRASRVAFISGPMKDMEAAEDHPCLAKKKYGEILFLSSSIPSSSLLSSSAWEASSYRLIVQGSSPAWDEVFFISGLGRASSL